jgi:hypothetical protein
MPASGYLAPRPAGKAPAGGAGRLGPEWPEVPVPVATALPHAVRATLAAVDADQTGAGCLEVRWRKQEAA